MDPQETIARMREATQALAAETERMREQREAKQRERERAEEEVREGRRRGEHGKDWQVLQQRIDLGQTTEFDVIQGLDLSSEARAVRKQMGEDIGRVADARAEDSDGPVELPLELHEAQEALVATLRRLQGLAE